MIYMNANIRLLLNAIIKFMLGLFIVCLLLFLPAGTIYYWNAWLFIALLFIPMFIFGIVLFFKDKDLLKKRLNMKEKQNNQKTIIILSAILFILGFIIAGLDFKYNWSNIHISITTISCIIFVLSYILYAEIIRENKYLSRTIEIQENQKVVDTGLYSIVRHPMYMAVTLLFLSIPLILGSFISFILFLFFPLLLTRRIKYEEKFLEKELQGYTEYMKKVKYKMIPFIW